jgi:hypothetical protein
VALGREKPAKCCFLFANAKTDGIGHAKQNATHMRQVDKQLSIQSLGPGESAVLP